MKDLNQPMSNRTKMMRFDALEVWPVLVVSTGPDGSDIVEPVFDYQSPLDADYWVLYGHYEDGGLEAIADFALEEDAQRVASLLRCSVFTPSDADFWKCMTDPNDPFVHSQPLRTFTQNL